MIAWLEALFEKNIHTSADEKLQKVVDKKGVGRIKVGRVEEDEPMEEEFYFITHTYYTSDLIYPVL